MSEEFKAHKVGITEKKKKGGKYRPTKDNVYLEVCDLDELIEVKSNKQRVNITINPYIWEQLGKITDNKSDYLQNLLKKIVEEATHKTIKFVSHD